MTSQKHWIGAHVRQLHLLSMAAMLNACAITDPPGEAPTAWDSVTTDKPEVTKDPGIEIDVVPAREQLEAEKAAAMASRGGSRGASPQNTSPDWHVSLSIDGDWRRWPGQSARLTATANQDVGPTPWYLIIVESDWLGARVVKICGVGVTCSASVTSPTSTSRCYDAYVAGYASAPPIGGQQAHSNAECIRWSPPTYIDLSTDRSTLTPGESVVLTATTDLDVGPSPWYISIVDVTAGTLIAACGSGKTCSGITSQMSSTTHSYIAYINRSFTTIPVVDSLVQSPISYVTWTSSGFVVDLQENAGADPHDIIATTNIDVGPTPYYITIFDVYTGALLTACGFGTRCALSVNSTNYCGYMVAFVSAYGYFPPSGIQASSETLLHVCIN